ncbi:MAG: hypothetical protein DRI90_06300 [Deltaproteobacteria bacterium]|nr:MAG: hypothetical protein DRI90_06300 [Deltaproteobacteria bacterium]
MDACIWRAVRGIEEVMRVTDDPLERLRLALRAHLVELFTPDSAVWLPLNEWSWLPSELRERRCAMCTSATSCCGGTPSTTQTPSGSSIAPGLDLGLVHLFLLGAANSVGHRCPPDGPRSPHEIADAFSALTGAGVWSEAAQPPHVTPLFASMAAIELMHGHGLVAVQIDHELQLIDPSHDAAFPEDKGYRPIP